MQIPEFRVQRVDSRVEVELFGCALEILGHFTTIYLELLSRSACFSNVEMRAGYCNMIRT
jgi:hypothetical protein